MDFTEILGEWYEFNKRDLPWRKTKDPYQVWLSEIILQQTRVNQGLLYFYRFIEAFPTVENLAKAPQDKILKNWEGLGYYSRAKNLHLTAKQLFFDYKSVFPSTYQGLLKLKGIGPYTAAAIASFCYDEPVPVVDGNVYRVLSRFYGIDAPIDSTAGKKYFSGLAQEVLNKNNPAQHNQAIMEFGAIQCLPKNPDCSACPLLPGCSAYRNKTIGQLPVKSKKVQIQVKYMNFVLVTDETESKFLIQKRDENEIWKNLYQIPLIEHATKLLTDKEVRAHKLVQSLSQGDLDLMVLRNEVTHQLTHRKIIARFWKLKIKGLKRTADFQILTKDDIKELAFPQLLKNVLKEEFCL